MTCSIALSGPIIRYTNYEKHFDIEESNPQKALQKLGSRYQDLNNILFKDRHWNDAILIYLNDDQVSYDELVDEDDCNIYLVVPLVGG